MGCIMKESNTVSNEILNNALKNNKISHAYLFETCDSLNDNELIFSFIKKIICPHKNNLICNKCNICKRIDNGNYSELKIIKPDGLWIKKEQLIELQKDFIKKPIESQHMIYVIESADKMNVSAANTILKFLEEPENGIIAILTTNNLNNVLPTIYSRCQIISLRKNNKILIDNYDEKCVEHVINYISLLEQEKIKIFSQIDELHNEYFTQRENCIKVFDIILMIYTDILNYLLTGHWEILGNKSDMLIDIVKNNNLNTIYKKIDLIIDIGDKIKYNTNINLLMDKFIIEFSGVD